MLHLDLAIRQGDFRLSADWTADAGERIAIIGPSGAGKSTLLMVIAGFFAAEGTLRWNGADLTALPPGKRPVTVLFQDQNLFPHLTLERNLGLGLVSDPGPAQQPAVDEAMARTGLTGLGARRPAQLSGGQQGRAALARALLRKRPILLLDEPFSALGPGLRAEMLDLVDAVAGDALVLMVTHDPADARRIAGRTVLLADGVAHPPAPTQALLDDPPPALRAYLGQ